MFSLSTDMRVIFYERLVEAHSKFSKDLKTNSKISIPSCKTRNEKKEIKHGFCP